MYHTSHPTTGSGPLGRSGSLRPLGIGDTSFNGAWILMAGLLSLIHQGKVSALSARTVLQPHNAIGSHLKAGTQFATVSVGLYRLSGIL